MQTFVTLFALTFTLVQCLPAEVAYAAPKNPDAAAPIVKQDTVVNFDGSFKNSFETGNGIYVEETGVPKAGSDGVFTAVQGANAYRSPDGSFIQTQYTADEHGYHAFGDHLPTPPPPNPIILRALEWLASLPSTQAPPSQAPYKNY